MLMSLRKWFRRVRERWFPVRWHAEFVEDPPDEVRTGRVYVVGEKSSPFQVIMDCPCGCRDRIYLDLVPSRTSQHWKLTLEQRGGVSLHPSVWRKDKCHSHFWLKDGKVRWT